MIIWKGDPVVPLAVLVIALFWIGAAVAVAFFAKGRGLDFWLSLILGLLISWLVMLVIAVAKGQRLEPTESPGEAEPSPAVPADSAPAIKPGPAATTKTCPDCAESVLVAARVCRFCGHRFDEPADSPTPGVEAEIPEAT